MYGGRKNNNGFHEIWGLRKHRDGSWDWTKPPNQNGPNDKIGGRYQHSGIVYGSLMINVGGKSNDNQCNNKFSVYDFDTLNWYEITGIGCFRHVAFIHGTTLYIHGGLNNNN